MQNNFKLDSFEPKQLKIANSKLDKEILSANLTKKINDEYKEKIFKESLWQKFLGLFR